MSVSVNLDSEPAPIRGMRRTVGNFELLYSLTVYDPWATRTISMTLPQNFHQRWDYSVIAQGDELGGPATSKSDRVHSLSRRMAR
jgi:hypothetical protein